MAIPKESITKMKELTKIAKEKGLIIPLSEAFRMFPVEEEIHKGKIEYWTGSECQ